MTAGHEGTVGSNGRELLDVHNSSRGDETGPGLQTGMVFEFHELGTAGDGSYQLTVYSVLLIVFGLGILEKHRIEREITFNTIFWKNISNELFNHNCNECE